MQGLTAYREAPGKLIDAKKAGFEVAGLKGEKAVGKGDAGVSFEVELPEGDTCLNGYFLCEDGKKIGSYYADVEKL